MGGQQIGVMIETRGFSNTSPPRGRPVGMVPRKKKAGMFSSSPCPKPVLSGVLISRIAPHGPIQRGVGYERGGGSP